MAGLEVLHEGPGYVVVRKPAGIATELNFDNDTVERRAHTLWRRPNSPKTPFVGIVHRLDRPVGGVLLLARNKSTLRRLNQAFAERRVRKTYVALTEKPLPETAGELRHLLGRDATRRRAVVAPRPGPGVSAAHLRYRLVGEEEGRFRYRIEPISGRFHQIRCQLAAAGAPIVGDAAYGAATAYRPQQICLHAAALSFPGAEGEITVRSEPSF